MYICVYVFAIVRFRPYRASLFYSISSYKDFAPSELFSCRKSTSNGVAISRTLLSGRRSRLFLADRRSRLFLADRRSRLFLADRRSRRLLAGRRSRLFLADIRLFYSCPSLRFKATELPNLCNNTSRKSMSNVVAISSFIRTIQTNIDFRIQY